MFGGTTDAIGFEMILAAQHQRLAAQRPPAALPVLKTFPVFDDVAVGIAVKGRFEKCSRRLDVLIGRGDAGPGVENLSGQGISQRRSPVQVPLGLFRIAFPQAGAAEAHVKIGMFRQPRTDFSVVFGPIVPAVLNTLASSPQPAMRPTLRDAFPEMHKGILK
jgi:hypothetical protein